jgi:hypothetical protein
VSHRRFTRAPRLAVAALMVAGTASLGIGAPASAERADVGLELVGQTFLLAPAGAFDVQFRLPDTFDPTTFADGDTVEIESHPAVADRLTLLRQRDDGPSTVTDRVTVSLDPAVPDARLAVDGRLLSVGLATETADETDDALSVGSAGVHPVTITVRVGARRAVLRSYVYRAPLDAGTVDALSIGLLMGQTSSPEISDEGVVGVTTAQRIELGALADSLDAVHAAATGLGVEVPPHAVAVQPSTLQAVGLDDPDLAARLQPLLAESELVAEPRLPLEPGAAAAADDPTHDTVALYTSLFSQGEDQLAAAVPGARIDRSLWLGDDALSDDGAILRRQLGTRLMVLPYEVYDQLEGSTHDLVDTTQLLTVELPDGTDLPAAIGDPHLEPQLDGAAAHPFATAIDVVADLLVMRREIEDDAGLVDRHGILLARSDHAALDPTFTRDLVTLLLSTPGLQLVDPADLGTSVTRWVLDGLPVTLQLPDHDGVDLAPRLALIDELSDGVVSYGSMLPDDDPRFARWSTILDAMPSTAVADDDADAMAETMRADFATFHDAIEVDASSFTLTGRNSDVRFALRNLTDVPLKVRVSLSSPKIRFPKGDQVIELPPGESFPVTFEAEALSNGTSSVFLRVYVPAENRDVQIVDEQVLTARVNSFAGLGQLVTGAGLLLVLTWWVRHWRQARRTQLSAQIIERHPSAGNGTRAAASTTPADGAADPATGSGELAPDAASSLPPS